MTKATVKERNKYLYIVVERTRLNDPIIDFLWYPLGVRAYHLDHLVGRKVRYLTGGVYQDNHNKRYWLVNRGTTKPTYTETISVPRPRTRVKTRWHNGRWQKYLKAKGWVNA